jgi:hypothetical protein
LVEPPVVRALAPADDVDAPVLDVVAVAGPVVADFADPEVALEVPIAPPVCEPIRAELMPADDEPVELCAEEVDGVEELAADPRELVLE